MPAQGMPLTTASDSPLFDQLLAALQHSYPPVRAGAAMALGKTGDARAVEPLADLLEDPVYLVYSSAERALSRMGSLAIGALMAVIQSPPSLDSASRAYEALRAIHDPQAIDLMIAATTYEEPFIRWGAIETLGHMRAELALPALLDATRHPDETTRQHAVTALGKLGRAEGIHAITTLLNETNWQMRAAAVQALGLIPAEEVTLPLLAAMRDPVPQVRETAAQMLSNLPSSAGEILVSALNGADAWTRRQLARALGEIKYARATPILESLALEDDDVQVRLSAAQSLARLNHPRGETVILRTLNAPSAHIRTWAAIALGNIGSPKAVAPLLENDLLLQKHKVPDARQVTTDTITALKQVGTSAILPLIETLASPDRARQEIAFKALAEIGPAAVPDLIITLRTSELPRIRQQVIRLSGMAGDARAVEPLAELLRRGATNVFSPRGLLRSVYDPAVEERKLAADALGNLGAPDAAAPLLAAAQYDLDQEVRTHAAHALAGSGDAEMILKLAGPSALGEVNRAFISLLALLAVGFIIGAFNRQIGDGRAGMLAGLAAGGLVGVLDGLTGQKRVVRGAWVGVGMLAQWMAFDALFFDSPPIETLIGFVPVRVGAIFLGAIGFFGSVFSNNPLLGKYDLRYVPRGCLSLGWPVVWGLAGMLVGGVSGAVLMLQAGNPTFFRWAGGITLGVLLVVSWLQRGNRMELPRGLWMAWGLFGLANLSLAFALSIPDSLVPWLMPLFPAAGAVTGFQSQPLIRRLAGLFGGVIAGFLGAVLGVWLMGMVK